VRRLSRPLLPHARDRAGCVTQALRLHQPRAEPKEKAPRRIRPGGGTRPHSVLTSGPGVSGLQMSKSYRLVCGPDAAPVLKLFTLLAPRPVAGFMANPTLLLSSDLEDVDDVKVSHGYELDG
jgi:hypothetical protein